MDVGSGGGLSDDEVLLALSQSYDLIVVTDLTLTVRFVSEGARDLLGFDPADVVGSNGLEFLHPEDVALFAAVVNLVERERYVPRTNSFYRFLRADGGYNMLEVLGGIVSSDGEPFGFWLIGRRPQQSEVYASVLHALLEEQSLARALEPIPEAMFPEVGAKVCLTCWPPGEPMFTVGDRVPPGLTGRNRRPGSIWDIAANKGEVVVYDDRDDLDAPTAALAAREQFASVTVTPIAGFGGEVVALLTVWGQEGTPPASSLLRLGERAVDLVAAAIRIRGRIDDLQRSARSDALTGLANRAAFEEALEANADASHVAILYVDLDYFKAINDRHGHLVGDQLLEVVARRMAGVVRGQDLVARLGGDEFAVLCPSCQPGEALQVAERLIESVREPIVVEGLDLEVGASVGVAHAAVYADDLLRRADDALYEAKSAGRGTARIHEL